MSDTEAIQRVMRAIIESIERAEVRYRLYWKGRLGSCGDEVGPERPTQWALDLAKELRKIEASLEYRAPEAPFSQLIAEHMTAVTVHPELARAIREACQ